MLKTVVRRTLRASITIPQTHIVHRVRCESHAPGHFLRPFSSSSQRRLSDTKVTMASSKSNTFTQKVVAAMEELYPLHLADTRWDNVGLLLDNTQEPNTSPIVLLTTDLTPDVADEAIKKEASVIITYHPIIFSGLKSLTHANPQQSALLSLARNNIAVYAPHTAVDASRKGVNEWLAGIVGYPNPRHKCEVVIPAAGAEKDGSAGYGRLVTLEEPRTVAEIVGLLGTHLEQDNISIAAPLALRHQPLSEAVKTSVSTASVCAGSGWDVLKGTVEKEVGQGGAELLVMGECSHHNALMATMKGRWVITVFHSNSERRFIKFGMMDQLLKVLKPKCSGKVEILASECDRDPFEIMRADGK